MKKLLISIFTLFTTISVFAGSNDVNMNNDYYTQIIIDALKGDVNKFKAQATKEMQSYFDDLSNQLGFGMSYHNSSPAQNLKFGILPTLEAGIDFAVLQIDTSDKMWSYVMPKDDTPAVFVIPRLHINMSLPFDFELSFSGAMVPTTNIYLIGGALKWSIIGTHDSFFNLAIAGNFTKLLGVDKLSMLSYGGNLSTSLDFKVLVPYLGAGIVKIHSSATVPNFSGKIIDNIPDEKLQIPNMTPDEARQKIKEQFDDGKPFVELKSFDEIKPNFFFGTRFDLWVLTFNAEVAFSYDFSRSKYINTIYSLRVNVSF